MLILGVLVLLDFLPASPEAPLRQPQLAARDGWVALAYGAGKEIRVAASKDWGATFSEPVKVAGLQSLMLGRHRGPRIALTRGAMVVTAVVNEGDLLAWRSTDHGKTWTAGRAVNDVPGAAREGLHALAADGSGRVFAAWLDLRRPGTSIYGAYSLDSGATWSANVLVYASPGGTVCECCHPSVAIADDGAVWVMWRNSLDGARDLYITHSRSGLRFAPAVKLGRGTWPLNACPMDGGGLAASGTRILAAWRRESAIYVSEPDKAERRIGDGKDPALAVAGGRAAVAWSEGAALRAWREGQAAPETLAGHGAFPALAPLADGGVLAGWEQDGGIALKRLP